MNKTTLVSLALLLACFRTASAQELIWQETFETDGEGTRYVTEGSGAYEPADFAAQGIPDSQAGPVYWTRTTEGVPSIVGVPAPTPAKRIVMAWDASIAQEDVTDAFLTHFDNVIDWLTGGKAKATILTVGGIGDVMINRLESKGHTIIEDDGVENPDPSTVDAFIYQGGASGRFVNYQVPGLVFNSSDLDDLLVSSIGTPLTVELPDVTITAPDHPSAGGQSGTAAFVKGENTFQAIGRELPTGATVVAAFTRTVSASVRNLDEADALFDGTTPNTGTSKASTSVADLVLESNPASQLPLFDWDFPVPGNPDGGFAVRVTGTMQVGSAGTFSLAIGANDGGRLRVDLDQNGLDAADNVILLDRRGPWQYSAPADVKFPQSGSFDFEWVSFNDLAEFGAELLVALDAGGNAPGVSEDDWDLLSTSSANVKLSGALSIETFIPDLPPQVVETPFTVALEAPEDGGLVFGGGPFTGFEGKHFYAGSALNKFTGLDGVVTPKKITWTDPIDISGKENVKLTLSLAATFLDFETSDFLQVFIDDGDDPFIWFTAPSGDDKFFNDVKTKPSNPTRLRLELQDVTYDIPPGLSKIRLRIEAVTTWWNEILGIDNIRVTSGDFMVEPSAIQSVSLTADGKVRIEFTGTLKSAESVGGPYTEVQGASSPAVVDPTKAAEFFVVE